jgi:hypothetical protein
MIEVAEGIGIEKPSKEEVEEFVKSLDKHGKGELRRY